jgi:hypothetical protein
MWCPNDKSGFDETQFGQIHLYTSAGKKLMELATREEVHNIVDLGTWNGLGTTMCLLNGMLFRDKKPNFISIECNSDKYKVALSNLHMYLTKMPSAKLLCGSIIKDSDMSDIYQVFPEMLSNSEYQRWHHIDVENIKLSNNVYDLLPPKIELVVFDGGEFTTYYEFKKIFDRCNRYIALDDCYALKTKRIREILQNSPEWTEEFFISERNGFALFRKKY